MYKQNRPPILYNRTIAIFLLIAMLSGCTQDNGNLNAGDWARYGYDYTNQRFSPLAEINTANVKKLQVTWNYHTGKTGTFQASPVVINGVMYITTPFNDVLALDAESGSEIWRYRHQLQGTGFCCGPANRGPAVAYGKVYMATIDARLIALDQQTGKVVWDIPITDPDTSAGETLEPLLGVKELHGAVQTGQTGYSANLAPQVYNGMVFVGITGAGYGLHLEFEENGKQILSVGGLSGGGHGLRGFLVAYDAGSGSEIWRWYSVPETGWEGTWQKTAAGISLNRDIEAEKKSFPQYKDTWRYGGGSVWSTPAIDPELGMIYFGTGNPSPQMDDTTRPGDNLYTVSLVALDIKTGKMQWHYQQVPHDRWGYDVASPPILLDFHRNGKTIKAVGQASKTGWFFIHDRRTGELLLRSEPFAPQDNLFARPTAEGVRIVPGTLGATSWSPVAFNPSLDTVFIAGIYQPSMFYARTLTPEPGKPWQSYTFFRQTTEADWGLFSAVSTATGKLLWQKKIDDPMVGGVLATAGGLVFTGEGNGFFDAFAADTGELLWRYQGKHGVNAPPITYQVDGKQYIAVAAGGNTIFNYAAGDEILVFSLPK